MKRALQLIVAVLLVFSTGSAFTLACAFACGNPPAVAKAGAPANHCHQTQKDLPGPGLGNLAVACPVLASLNTQGAFQLPSPVPAFKILDLGLTLLAPETACLRAEVVVYPAPVAPPPPSLPFYLQHHILRV